jgi:putative peptidoglycan lipid II flippase
MRKLKAQLGALVLLSAAGSAVSFVSQLLIAYHFGTSAALDTYWASLALVTLLCFYMAPLKEALVPAVHRAHQQGDAQAGRVLSVGLFLLLVLAMVSCGVLLLSASSIARLITDGGSGAASAIVALVPWLLPYLLVFVLAETLNTMLISFNQVLRQAMVRIAAALVLLAAVALLGAELGVAGLLLAQILSMVVLVVASGWAFRNLGLRFVTKFWPVFRDSGMLPLFVSLLLTYFLAQVYILLERSAMIHLGTGLVSGFQYSTALVNVIIGLLAIPLANLLWSQFLSRVAEGDGNGALALAVRACGLLYYVLMVVCVFVWVNAQEIISLLFGRGAFNEASVQITTMALRATVFAAIPIGIQSVLGRWLMSLPAGAHRQVWIGLATTTVGLLVIGLAVWAQQSPWILLHWLLANLAGMFVSVLIFVRTGKFDWRQKLFAARWLMSAGLAAAVAAWITPSFSLGASWMGMAAALFAEGVLYLVIVLGLSWAFRMTYSLRLMLWGAS